MNPKDVRGRILSDQVHSNGRGVADQARYSMIAEVLPPLAHLPNISGHQVGFDRQLAAVLELDNALNMNAATPVA